MRHRFQPITCSILKYERVRHAETDTGGEQQQQQRQQQLSERHLCVCGAAQCISNELNKVSAVVGNFVCFKVFA